MITLGLTGGIGMGKSVSAGFLRAHKLPVVDTDQLARQIVAPGQRALQEIAAHFGASLVDPSGNLRREALAAEIFGDAEKRRELEAIMHPRIHTLWRAAVEAHRQAGVSACAVVIPLLFETGTEGLFDHTVCVGCSPRTQHERLATRGWTLEHRCQRIAAQWPVERKMALSNFVIWTEAGLDVHREQIDRVMARILET